MEERRQARKRKLLAAKEVYSSGKIVPQDILVDLLGVVIESGNRVCLEGDNQKQADYLCESLCQLDPERVNNLHLLLSTIGIPQQLDLFEIGIASKVDCCYAGPQGVRFAEMIKNKQIEVGSIHTYNELYSRYCLDLRPDVCCLVAVMADKEGNLYLGGSTEETPAIVETTAFQNGIVIAQANKIVDSLPRIDVPHDWVDFVVEATENFHMEPLFTRDPAAISETMILMGMIAMKGIYAEYLPKTINHGVGFNTAAIELMLPTYGVELGLKGRAVKNWILNPHPTMIPAIESGFVESIFPPGGELGMGKFVSRHADIFPVGYDGSLRSNRPLAQLGGHFGVDIFVGASLQIDSNGNSSTVTTDRITGFGGAPNFGCDAAARRHSSSAWLKAGKEAASGTLPRGRKLVVQIVETFQKNMRPTFVEKLDAIELADNGTFPIPPVMIYGEDISHIVTEEGVANLLLCRTQEEREQAIRGIAGYTGVGMARDKKMVAELRERGVIQTPEDLGISKLMATRDLLAARSVRDLVTWSDGLYEPPSKFRNW